MSTPTPYYFLRIQNNKNNTATTLLQQHQQFKTWLTYIEQTLATLPPPLYQQYDQQGIVLCWETKTPLSIIITGIEQLTNNSTIALDQGTAIYDSQRQWCYSKIPERLIALLQVGQHYEQALIVGEAASTTLPKENLEYLTRSYFPGATTALEVYAWKE